MVFVVIKIRYLAVKMLIYGDKSIEYYLVQYFIRIIVLFLVIMIHLKNEIVLILPIASLK